MKSFFSEISQKLPVFVTLKSNSRSWNSSICQENSSSSSFSAKKLFSALTKLENKTDVVLSYLFVTFFFVLLFHQRSHCFIYRFFPFKLIKLKQLNHCGIYARGKIIEALCPNTTEILAASSRLSHTICFLHHHIFK